MITKRKPIAQVEERKPGMRHRSLCLPLSTYNKIYITPIEAITQSFVSTTPVASTPSHLILRKHKAPTLSIHSLMLPLQIRQQAAAPLPSRKKLPNISHLKCIKQNRKGPFKYLPDHTFNLSFEMCISKKTPPFYHKSPMYIPKQHYKDFLEDLKKQKQEKEAILLNNIITQKRLKIANKLFADP
jgi:hypothetical protein